MTARWPRLSSRWVQDHLSTAKQRDDPAGFVMRNGCVPNLSRPSQVLRRGFAGYRSFTGGAEEIALQLNGRESRRTLRHGFEAAVTARRVGQCDHGRRVQEPIRRQKISADR